MAVRGNIAVRQNDGGWIGVYNHNDSYPTVLGSELWTHLKNNNIAKVCTELLKYDVWENYLKGDSVCPYCGKPNLGQPHTVSMALLTSTGTGYLDPEAKNHKHNSLDDKITDKNDDPLFTEWLYVIEPNKNILSIYKSTSVDEHKYKHSLVREVPLDGPEPNWEELEFKGDQMADKADEELMQKPESS